MILLDQIVSNMYELVRRYGFSLVKAVFLEILVNVSLKPSEPARTCHPALQSFSPPRTQMFGAQLHSLPESVGHARLFPEAPPQASWWQGKMQQEEVEEVPPPGLQEDEG